MFKNECPLKETKVNVILCTETLNIQLSQGKKIITSEKNVVIYK